jgi:hypothetical protein
VFLAHEQPVQRAKFVCWVASSIGVESIKNSTRLVCRYFVHLASLENRFVAGS